MIARMLKTYVVARNQERAKLLEALRTLGVVHLTPVNPAKAVAHEETVAAIDRLRRAQQLLADIEPAGTKPADITTIQAAEEAQKIQRVAAERRNRLANLHRQIGQLEIWGDVRLDQFATLRDAGLQISFHSLPEQDVPEIKADFVQVVASRFGRGVLVGVVNRDGEPTLPDSAEPVELPQRDRHNLRNDAAEIDQAITTDEKRLAALAHFAGDMPAEIDRLTTQSELTVAERGGLAEGELYAVQGWCPADAADSLKTGLAKAGIDAAVSVSEPAEEEEPPTLVRYPGWSTPIKGLFDILGTFPGYKELDLAPFFMVALPIFAGMLIGDAGYGLLFLLLPLIFHRKLVKVAGKEKVNLILVVGAVTLIWGMLTGNYFGVTPESMMTAGGHASVTEMAQGTTVSDKVGSLMVSAGVLWDPNPEKARAIVIQISFLLGMIHLVLGHLRQAIGFFPSSKALSEIGWGLVLVGMLGIIWLLFKQGMPKYFIVTGGMLTATYWLLGVGYVLAVLFAFPGEKPVKRVLFGFANSLLPMLGTFGDTMSYIRLMAVGLASYYIASAFNGLGAMVAQDNAFLWILGVPVIVFGHALNIGLAIIAIFAHGVRLNMLEFSSNAGVQWAGFPYEPFADKQGKES